MVGAEAHSGTRGPGGVVALYVGTGLVFMLVPGTFLGVWNLLQVSARQSVGLVSPAWLQAHGHAQVFGWVATFILGIGFYAVPIARAGARPPLVAARVCWALWTSGVAMRWTANVYGWHWRTLVPLSAALEVAAFAIFFHAVSQHRAAAAGSRLDPWVRVVAAAATGFAATLLMNLGLSIYVAWYGSSPAVPHALDQRFLAFATWGFLAPFVWGFSARWLPVLLGLRPTRTRWLAAAVLVNVLGVVLTTAGSFGLGAVLFVAAAAAVITALRMFEPSVSPAKTRGVHPSFPAFVRTAYVWLLVAALLGVAATQWDVAGGLWGASRHAFTVGFVSLMVFSIGQRVLPAFAAMGPLWSPRLMLAGSTLLTLGCALRVGTEIVAYQSGAAWAWSVLPVSAVLELTAVTVFAVNMAGTYALAGDAREALDRGVTTIPLGS